MLFTLNLTLIMKSFNHKFIFTLLFVISINATAQDVIVKKDGSTILSKVLEVSETQISYKKFKSPDGPTYKMNTTDIRCINYENGDRDDFNGQAELEKQKNTETFQATLGMFKGVADERNDELIDLNNQEYLPGEKVKVKDKKGYQLAIFGIRKESLMSTKDVEMEIIGGIRQCEDGRKRYEFNIRIKNKTDHTLYIDKGNCFRLNSDGSFLCYYDGREQLTVGKGGSSGGSIGLGSIAGVLGIGGTIGQLAGGVNVGGNSNRQVSTTYTQQRVITIPPHGQRNLNEEKYVRTRKDQYEVLERSEGFSWMKINIFNDDKRRIRRGEVLLFDENDINWKREFIITYSFDEYFQSYSTLNASLFVHQVFGVEFLYDWEKMDKYIQSFNPYTICGDN